MAVRTIAGEKRAARSIASETAVPEVLTGAAAAALSAAGIGSFILGLVVAIAEVNAAFANSINFLKPVGPLSGKTTIGIVGWLLSWVVMATIFRGKNPAIGKVFALTILLIMAGLALTFPPVFELLAGG